MARVIAERVEPADRLEVQGPRPEVLARYERRRLTGELAGVFDAVLGSTHASMVSRGQIGVN